MRYVRRFLDGGEKNPSYSRITKLFLEKGFLNYESAPEGSFWGGRFLTVTPKGTKKKISLDRRPEEGDWPGEPRLRGIYFNEQLLVSAPYPERWVVGQG